MSSWGLYSQTWNKASVSYWAVCGAGLRNGTASRWNQCPRRPQWSCGAPGRTHSPTAPSYLTRKQIWTLMLLTRLWNRSWKWLARPLLTHCQTGRRMMQDIQRVTRLVPPVTQCRPALTCEENSTGYAKLGAPAIVAEPETPARWNDQVFPALCCTGPIWCTV